MTRQAGQFRLPQQNTIAGGAAGGRGLDYRQTLLPVLEAGRLGSRCQRVSLWMGALFHVCRRRGSPCIFTWWREVIGLMSLLLGTLIPLTPPLRPNYLLKVLPSNIITLGIRSMAYELRGRDPTIHTHSPQSLAHDKNGLSVSHRNCHIHLKCASIINDQKCIS